LAPEIILSKGYNKSVDFWSVGILLFELLTRKTPFAHDNMVNNKIYLFKAFEILQSNNKQAMVYQKIVESEENLIFIFNNSSFDSVSKHLLGNLLINNPNTRIGMLRNGCEDIWSHNLMKGYSKESVNRRTVASPYM
jgi:serine/threonine protein kinase